MVYTVKYNSAFLGLGIATDRLGVGYSVAVRHLAGALVSAPPGPDLRLVPGGERKFWVISLRRVHPRRAA